MLIITFLPTHLHSTPLLGGFPSEYCHDIWCKKTRMVWLPNGEKKIGDMFMFIHVDTIHERDKHTHTHRHRACIGSRGKNDQNCTLMSQHVYSLLLYASSSFGITPSYNLSAPSQPTSHLTHKTSFWRQW